MQIKFAICCKKIHKVGCENSQSDGKKVNNYQPLKTISCRRIKRIERKLERLLRDQYKREILVIRVSRLISSVRQHREVDS